MRTITQITGIKPTKAIESYVTKKLASLDRLVKHDESAVARAEVGLSNRHHKKGDIYFAEVNVRVKGKQFRSVEQGEDLYAAIDAMKDEILREVTAFYNKKRTIGKRAGRTIKKRIRST